MQAELAAGALQHIEDDHWFHKTRAFAEATARLGRIFRDYLGPGDGFRCGFLGHIACELILDAILIERYPERLDRITHARATRRRSRLEKPSLIGRSAGRLEPWLPRFCEAQFLRDYADPERLAYRLNQVLRRIKLDPLPAGVEELLATARGVVRSRRGAAPAVAICRPSQPSSVEAQSTHEIRHEHAPVDDQRRAVARSDLRHAQGMRLRRRRDSAVFRWRRRASSGWRKSSTP